MELERALQIHIKQEPMEEISCEQFNNNCSERMSSSSDQLSEISSRPEVDRGEKRKELDGMVSSVTEKRTRYEQTDASDIEIFAEDYRNTKPIQSLTKEQNQERSSSTESKILGKLGKFQCLLCDDAFDTENELMYHLSVIHKHMPNNRRQSSRFARHTCQICFARFRTLKDFFNHTSCHTSHPGLSPIDREISTRVSNSLSKNALQNYFLNAASGSGFRDLMQPSFKCDCCNTVFVNRDSYAMHVMMRVKNESCKMLNGCDPSMDMNVSSGGVSLNGDLSKSPGSNVGSQAEDGRIKADESSPPELHQAYYIDVTSSAEKDEYLQSVLAKNATNVTASESFDVDSIRAAIKNGRKCVVCEERFDDQDSLAMHVMSRHSDGMTSSQSTVNSTQFNKTPSPPTPPRLMKYFTPFKLAHDRLLTLHAEVLCCQYCGESFVNRDTLAMHVLTHMGDHRTSGNSSMTSESQHLNSKHHESIDSRLRGQNENSVAPSIEINTDEPLDLASKKNLSSGSNSSEKENRGTSDMNVSIDLRMSREDTQTDAPIKETKTSHVESKFDSPIKDITQRNHVEVKLGKQNNGALEFPETAQESLWTRSASAPSMSVQAFSGTSERAASTGCLPSANQMAGIATDYIFDARDMYRPRSASHCTQQTYDEMYETNVGEKTDKSFKITVSQSEENLNGSVVHSGDSLEGLLGFKKPEVTPPTQSSQLVGCPSFMAADGKEPNLMSVLMKNKDLHMCKYCEIIFPNRTLYYLHMGLHNVNTPWQCNLCGKVCANVHDFNAHIIHL